MTYPCFDAPRRTRTAATTLVVALLAGLLALAAPAPPAGAAPVVQTAGPQGGCPPNSFHSFQAIAYCHDTELTYEITVGGEPVTSATRVAPGDVITVAASAAEGQHTDDLLYAETGDAIRNNDPDLFAELRIGLPAATGTLLSEPTAIRMARDDTLGRGANANGSCALQAGEGPNLSDPVTYVDPSDAPLGQSGMLVHELDGQLRARWSRLGYDRCASALSLNGISTGFSVVFEQRVLRRGSADQTLSWLFDGLTISRYDEAQSRTWGTPTPVALGITKGSAPPSPGTPTAVAGNGQATVTWRAANGNGGAPVTGWEVVPYVGSQERPAQVIDSPDPSAVVTGLTNGTTYTFRVRTRTVLGTSGLGPASNAVTPMAPSSVPGQVALGAAPSPGNRRAFVRWTIPDDGGAPLTGYRVTPYIGGVPQAPQTFGATATAQQVTQLTNGRAHTFTVAASNRNGYGAESPHTVAVTPLGWPTEVLDAKAEHVSGGTVRVRFTEPESDGGRPISRYEVTPFRDGTELEPVQSFTDARGGLLVTGLRLGSSYVFSVVAVNEIGTGSFGGYTNAVVPLARAGAPTITGTTAGNRTIDVTWTAPTSSGGVPIDGYEITATAGGAFVASTTVGAGVRTARLTGLTNGVGHLVTVTAHTSFAYGQAGVGGPVTPRGIPHAPFASADAFTRRQFADLAGRAPTSAELGSWRTALANGSRSPAELVESLRTGTYWDGTLGPIVRLYRAVYLRDPDVGGLRYWEGQVRSGRKSLNQVAGFMATNQEFRTLYGTLSNAAFVTKVYQLVLGRSPSASDLTYWTGQIDRGQSRGRIVLLFSSSTEYKARTAHRVAVVEITYGMLDRVPTTAQADLAVAALAGGQTYRDLVSGVLGSPEYAATV